MVHGHEEFIFLSLTRLPVSRNIQKLQVVILMDTLERGLPEAIKSQAKHHIFNMMQKADIIIFMLHMAGLVQMEDII